jgi:methylated-DNA-[protein]-cysteine S-methyltransferase
VKIPVYYFKPEVIDPYIFIIYDYKKTQNIIKLRKIDFFKDESDILKYIKDNRLKLVDNSDQKVYSILLEVRDIINAYLKDGKTDLFKTLKEMGVSFDLDDKFNTPFSESILKALLKIKPGEITTYSDLAKSINSKAYRAVGGVLRNNALPLIVPCHRVVKKDGKLGGFMGKMDKDWQTNLKRSLLKIEGNVISD